jgi:carbamoyl-phosphate synthase large subunit
MNNILITSVGRRVELVEFFKIECQKLNQSIKVFCTDLSPDLSSACLVADHFFKSPKINSRDYIDFLKRLCFEYSIKLIVPTNDNELLVLSENREGFLKLGVNIIISDQLLVKACRNKNYTSKLLNDINIDTPCIYDFKNLYFPCFVKPYDGSSSNGAFPLFDESMLTKSIAENPKNIYMELIPDSYDEYTIDLYFDRFGELKTLVPRVRLETRAGEISKGLTMKESVYEYLKKRLCNLKGAKGPLTLQLFFNPNKDLIKAIEINPRFGGGYPLSYSAGANFPKMLISEYILGNEIDFMENWEENLLMLRYDAKLLVHDYKA